MNASVMPLRAIVHILVYLGIALIYQLPQLAKTTAIMIYLSGGIPIITGDWARRHIEWWHELCAKVLRSIIKQHELKELSAIGVGIIGMGIAIFWFDPIPAILAAVMTASLDPAARVFGILYGNEKIYNTGKTVAGLFGGVLVGYIACVLWSVGWSYQVGYMTLFFAACVAGIAEVFSGNYDNLMIPVSAGLVLHYA